MFRPDVLVLLALFITTLVHAAPTGYVEGLDICEHDGPAWLDLEQQVAAGARFVWIRCTFGSSGVDSRFQENWDNARRLGLIRGAYHIAQPLRSPGSCQALEFSTRAGRWATADGRTLPGALVLPSPPDESITFTPYTRCYGLVPELFRVWISDFITFYTAWNGRPPVVYGRPMMLEFCLNGNPLVNLRGAPLWTVHPHTENTRRIVPRPWWNVDLDINLDDGSAHLGRRGWTFWSYRAGSSHNSPQPLNLSCASTSSQSTETSVTSATSDSPFLSSTLWSGQGLCGNVIRFRGTLDDLQAFARNERSPPAITETPFPATDRQPNVSYVPWEGPFSTNLAFARGLPRIDVFDLEAPAPRCDNESHLPPEVVWPPRDSGPSSAADFPQPHWPGRSDASPRDELRRRDDEGHQVSGG